MEHQMAANQHFLITVGLNLIVALEISCLPRNGSALQAGKLRLLAAGWSKQNFSNDDSSPEANDRDAWASGG